MLQVDSVNLFADKIPLLVNISMNVVPGTVLAVVGPNGAGKTSLLKVMSGEREAASGTVLLQGKELSDWSRAEQSQIMAVLPQQSMLNFPFQVGEVVALGRYPHGTGLHTDKEIIDLALQAVDASHLKYRDYTTLSGGEQQRVHLARVLTQIWELHPQSNNPSAQLLPGTQTPTERYLLLDEPTAALDLAHQHKILQVAKSMAQKGVGVLVILHDLNLAAHYADSIVMLNKGSVVASGDTVAVLKIGRAHV